MTECDYCDEGLPLWHRREDDYHGDQFTPCMVDPVSADLVLSMVSKMIEKGFTRQEIALVKQLALGRMA